MMIVTFHNAIPLDNHILQVTTSNGNRLKFDFKPYLNTIQFAPLKDPALWQKVEVGETCLYWRGCSGVELSLDTLLAYFKLGGNRR